MTQVALWKRSLAVGLFCGILLVAGRFLHARTGEDTGSAKGAGGIPVPAALDQKAHDVNDVYLMVSNNGVIGSNQETGTGAGFFPRNTPNNYVFGTGLWFGARYDANGDGIVDKVFTEGYNPLAGDSEFREGTNDQDRNDPLARVFDSTEPEDLAQWPDPFRSEDPETGGLVPLVLSDQDLVTTYTTQDKVPIFGPSQMPIEVRQRSLAFQGGLAGQAILFIWEIRNWGDVAMRDCWIGYDSDMDVGVAFWDDEVSFLRDRVRAEGDAVKVNMAYAWDSDFREANFTGDPGFVGIAYLRSPGNPTDGIDNEGDGLIDESPFNGIDDDGDGEVDEPDEVDELGLVNFSRHCSPSGLCEVMDPQTDQDGYDLLSCNSPGSYTSCLESTTPSDIRFMISSGPFDWEPGQTIQVAMTLVFAHPTGDRSVPFYGDPPRPDPNDDDLVELLAVKETVQRLFDLDFRPAEPPVPPHLTLVPGDGQVTLFWDDLSLRTPDPLYPDFVEIDPSYREYDFEGYRVWRSRTGDFSRLGDPEDPHYPLTPEAVQQNRDVSGLDLALLSQYDLADGITTESHGVTCSDSIIQVDSSVVYTSCDTFDLGTDTGLRYSYVDRGDSAAPLINGFRYYYAVTAYDYNSGELPVSRLSLDSGVSFTRERSAVPRTEASSFVDAFARVEHVDTTGVVLDDTSSIFVSAETSELDPPDVVHASNALVGFAFTPGEPEAVSDGGYTLLLGDFERIDEATNRVPYRLEDASGATLNAGADPSFELTYDGRDRAVSVALFDPADSTRVIFTSELTFNADTAAFVLPDPLENLLAESATGSDIHDSLGTVRISGEDYIPAGYRGTDIRLEWTPVDAGGDTLTLRVTDLDNRVAVPFGEGIVDSAYQVVQAEEGSNWSFLPVQWGQVRPGGRYFVTTQNVPILDLWVCGVRVTASGWSRWPRAGDVWTLREVSKTEETAVETTSVGPDSVVVDTTVTYLSGRRPPVPGGRYRLDTQSGGPDVGRVDLAEIRVVPNPYLGSASWDLGPTQRRLEFIHLPPECTIRIYTISGVLVRVLDHTPEEGGTEVYDLLTREGLPLASGNYYYHVTTPGGKTHLGRFGVVQ